MTIQELAVKQRNIARTKIVEECNRFANLKNPSVTDCEIHEDILRTMGAWLHSASVVLGG